MPKLNQVLSIEKGTKSRIYSEFSRMHNAVQKAALLNGFAKTYQKKDEDGDSYPPERQRVQVIASDVLSQAGRLLSLMVDLLGERRPKGRAGFVFPSVDPHSAAMPGEASPGHRFQLP